MIIFPEIVLRSGVTRSKGMTAITLTICFAEVPLRGSLHAHQWCPRVPVSLHVLQTKGFHFNCQPNKKQ